MHEGREIYLWMNYFLQEEKRKKKMEEEQQRKEERERKRKEQEERIKNMRKPNFVITKHSDGEHQGEVTATFSVFIWENTFLRYPSGVAKDIFKLKKWVQTFVCCLNSNGALHKIFQLWIWILIELNSLYIRRIIGSLEKF